MPLDRIVYLQEPVVAHDTFGSEVTTWTTRAAWLIHFLLFLTRGKTRPAMPIE